MKVPGHVVAGLLLVFLLLKPVEAAPFFQRTANLCIRQQSAELDQKLAGAESVIRRADDVNSTLQSRSDILARREAGLAPARDVYAWMVNAVNSCISSVVKNSFFVGQRSSRRRWPRSYLAAAASVPSGSMAHRMRPLAAISTWAVSPVRNVSISPARRPLCSPRRITSSSLAGSRAASSAASSSRVSDPLIFRAPRHVPRRRSGAASPRHQRRAARMVKPSDARAASLMHRPAR